MNSVANSASLRRELTGIAHLPDGNTSEQRLYPVNSRRTFSLHGKVVSVELRSPVRSATGSDSEEVSVDGPWCQHIISHLEGHRASIIENLAADLRHQLKQVQAVQRDCLTADQLAAFQVLDFYCRQL